MDGHHKLLFLARVFLAYGHLFSQMILVFLWEPSGNTISKHTLESAVWNFAWSYANKVRAS